MKPMTNSLRSRPFRATPDTRLYFPHPSIESARETAVRAIIRSEGPVMILGAAGYGKSLLGDLVAEQLDDRLEVVKLRSARLCSRRALLQNILFELGMPYRELSEGELRLSILDRLEPSPETAPEGILIVVDEAHTLHWKLLEELRLISNYTRNGHPRVKLLLLGNLQLEETLANPQMESFNQRLAARCYLQPMNRQETAEFIRHQFRQSAEDPESRISAEAIQIVYSACEGIPRLVNQLMDHAIVMAAEKNLTCITAEVISEAWAEQQQLPAPWTVEHDKVHAPASGGTVEFGELEDEGDLESAPSADRDEEPAFTQATKVAAANNFFSVFANDAAQQLGGHAPLEDERLEDERLEGEELEGEALEGEELEDEEPTEYELERIDCLEQEQSQFGDAGLWENDPPLINFQPSEAFYRSLEEEQQLVFDARQSNSPLPASDIFGDDFDQEIQLPAVASPSSTASEAADYLVRMERYTEMLSGLSATESTLDSAASTTDCETILPCLQPSDSSSPADRQAWSVDVVPESGSDGLVNSIEDMVSQLNFSAFSMEAFSVEQIPLYAQSLKACAELSAEEEREDNLNASPSGAHQFSHGHAIHASSTDFDDDRDILIIEEEIPASRTLLEKNLPSEPTHKTVPYSQLFAKLRK